MASAAKKRTMGAATVAARLGVTRRQIYRWRDEGAPHDSDNTFDEEELREWATRTGALARTGGNGGRPLEVERLAREEAAAAPPVPGDHGPAPGARPAPVPARPAPPPLTAPPQAGAPGDFDGDQGATDEEAIHALITGNREVLVKLAPRLSPLKLKQYALMGRTRRELAEAERRELDNRKVRGELLEASAVRAKWLERATLLKSHFVALPGKLATRVAAATGRGYDEVYAALDEELTTLLRAVTAGTPAEGSR